MSDWSETPEAQAWLHRALTELAPMIEASAVTVSLAPRGETDVKFAVELGLSIMFDKPIIVAVTPGQPIPDHLRRVADDIVEISADGFTKTDGERIMAAARRHLPNDERGD